MPRRNRRLVAGAKRGKARVLGAAVWVKTTQDFGYQLTVEGIARALRAAARRG